MAFLWTFNGILWVLCAVVLVASSREFCNTELCSGHLHIAAPIGVYCELIPVKFTIVKKIPVWKIRPSGRNTEMAVY